jgi:hypothetical protein
MITIDALLKDRIILWLFINLYCIILYK